MSVFERERDPGRMEYRLMKLNAYGRLLEVVREHGEWIIYRLGEGTRARTNDVVIPAEYSDAEVITYLEDILHEAATPERPRITVVG